MPSVNRPNRPWLKKAPGSQHRKPSPVRDDLPDNFYNLKPWRTLRQLVLDEEPTCRECRKNKRITQATEVDHIVPIRLGGEPLDRANLAPICRRHHAIKSRMERDIPTPKR